MTQTRKDVSFGFLCFAADNLIVNAVGLISLLWLLMYLGSDGGQHVSLFVIKMMLACKTISFFCIAGVKTATDMGLKQAGQPHCKTMVGVPTHHGCVAVGIAA